MNIILNSSKRRIVFTDLSKLERIGIETLATSSRLNIWCESANNEVELAVYAYSNGPLQEFLKIAELEATHIM